MSGNKSHALHRSNLSKCVRQINAWLSDWNLLTHPLGVFLRLSSVKQHTQSSTCLVPHPVPPPLKSCFRGPSLDAVWHTWDGVLRYSGRLKETKQRAHGEGHQHMHLVCFNPSPLFESQLGTHTPGLFESQGGTHAPGWRRKICDRVVLKPYSYCDIYCYDVRTSTGVPLDKLFYTKSGEKRRKNADRRYLGMLNAMIRMR